MKCSYISICYNAWEAKQSDIRCWTIFSIIVHKKGVLYILRCITRPLCCTSLNAFHYMFYYYLQRDQTFWGIDFYVTLFQYTTVSNYGPCRNCNKFKQDHKTILIWILLQNLMFLVQLDRKSLTFSSHWQPDRLLMKIKVRKLFGHSVLLLLLVRYFMKIWFQKNVTLMYWRLVSS